MELNESNTRQATHRTPTSSPADPWHGSWGDLSSRRIIGRCYVEAVAARAGTNKNAIYRRYNGLPEAAVAALSARFGRDFDVDTSRLELDIRFVVERLARFFTDPLIQQSGLELLAAIRADEQLTDAFEQGFMAPRRATIRKIVEGAVARGEIASQPDHEWVTDLLVAPFLLRALVPGTPPIDTALIEELQSTALTTLGYRRNEDGEAR